MSQVVATVTPVSDADLFAAIRAALPISDATLAILCAHVALETAHGARVVQWNVGNYKRGPGPDWCEFETSEWLAPTGSPPGTAPARTSVTGQFSAWPDLAGGCAFYAPAFARHWPEAWAGALAGDCGAFCAGLKARGYYTAPEPLYAAGVARWQTYYLALLAGDDEHTEPDLSDLGETGTVTIPRAC